ncbi:hypothetical protein MKJ01_17065 [Chryseobacterium sp. SSA4.19]|uniref:hypothetical protein n=1 Tax=Chryseobacterium sp. SSA4.19 TaxID=2919915 RepID=UPI001F4EA173|nr:hypothetical protein [Chryseobacterium sp. SSA4.19]MCJ8155471.1 hypothetical protein [Chryseobacterium sp. SSA4.19]
MSNTIFFCFIIGFILFAIGKTIYFFIERKKILKTCKQINSIELKNINGTIFTDAGRNKRFEWCLFNLLINDNSIFLFSLSLSFIPLKITNLLFSNSKRKNTRKTTLLREYKIDKNSVEFVYYPDYLVTGHKKITLKNLTSEQILIFENLLDGKSRRFY